jgi:hypothetical protein
MFRARDSLCVFPVLTLMVVFVSWLTAHSQCPGGVWSEGKMWPLVSLWQIVMRSTRPRASKISTSNCICCGPLRARRALGSCRLILQHPHVQFDMRQTPALKCFVESSVSLSRGEWSNCSSLLVFCENGWPFDCNTEQVSCLGAVTCWGCTQSVIHIARTRKKS